MKKISTKTWILAGVMLVVVFLLTWLICITNKSDSGYVVFWNLGDVGVYVSAVLLGGPLGALVSGLGSALGDLAAGQSGYAIATFFIKGIMALLLSWYAKRGHTLMHLIKSVCVSGGFMVLGYFIYDLVIRNNYTFAALGLPFNILQGIASGLISVLVLFLLGGKSYRQGDGFHYAKSNGYQNQAKRNLK